MFRPAEDLYAKLSWTLFFVYVHVILFLRVYCNSIHGLSPELPVVACSIVKRPHTLELLSMLTS